jgi:hypothetical protein
LAWNLAAFVFLWAFFRELTTSAARETVAGMLLTAAGVSGLFGNAHKIEVFKLYGLEARTRQVVAEAEEALIALRALAADFGAAMVLATAATGRLFGREQFADRDAEKAAILRAVSEVGVTHEQLRKVEQADRKYVLVDYALGIMRGLREANGKQNARVAELLSAFNKSGLPPTASQLREVANSQPPIPLSVEELLLDLEHYEARGVHRRPAVWAERGHWVF